MLKRMTMAQQEFYLRQENGIELMQGVKNLSVGPGAASRIQVSHDDREGFPSFAFCTRVIMELSYVVAKICGEIRPVQRLLQLVGICCTVNILNAIQCRSGSDTYYVGGTLLGTLTTACHDHLHTPN